MELCPRKYLSPDAIACFRVMRSRPSARQQGRDAQPDGPPNDRRLSGRRTKCSEELRRHFRRSAPTACWAALRAGRASRSPRETLRKTMLHLAAIITGIEVHRRAVDRPPRAETNQYAVLAAGHLLDERPRLLWQRLP